MNYPVSKRELKEIDAAYERMRRNVGRFSPHPSEPQMLRFVSAKAARRTSIIGFVAATFLLLGTVWAVVSVVFW